MFEDSLKYAASSLSNKTDASSLVSLLRQTAFLDNQELAGKLVEYLKQKTSQLSNEELSQVYASFVLLKPVFVEQKMLKVMEYLTLRRVHSLDYKEIALIISSYGYLCRQGKALLSSSLIKTFEFVIVNKMHEFTQDDLAVSLVALIKLQRLSSKTKIINNQTLLELFDRFNYELEDHGKPIKVSNLAETYYQVLSHEALRKEIDSTQMEVRLSGMKGFKGKDIFNVLSVCT